MEQFEMLVKALDNRPTIDELDHALSQARLQQKRNSSLDNYNELVKALDTKADREDVTRISKIIVDIESSTHLHLEEEERRQSAMVRHVRAEVERHVRAELDKHVRSEVALQLHVSLEAKESEWREERQEELAVKANITEVHQVRKDTADLASRILGFSRDLHDLQASLPRKVEAALLTREANSHGDANGLLVPKADKTVEQFQSRMVLEQLRDELDQLKAKLKKKAEKSEVQDLLKAWNEMGGTGTHQPQSPQRGKSRFITRDEIGEMLKQKVDFNEFVNSLSLKLDNNDLHLILSREYQLSTKTHANGKSRDQSQAIPTEIKAWVEHIVSQLEQSLHNKAEVDDFTELKEQLQKKLDVTVFLQAQTEINDNTRKLDRDLRDLFHTLRLQNPTSSSLTFVHTAPSSTSSPSKKQTFINHTPASQAPRSYSPTPRPIFDAPSTTSHTPIPNNPSIKIAEHPSSSNSYTPDPSHITGGRWFKDVKPTRYLEILKELNNMKSLQSDKGVS